ncbi:hypothetical protein [Cetobacterium sp.]
MKKNNEQIKLKIQELKQEMAKIERQLRYNENKIKYEIELEQLLDNKKN